MSPYRRALGDPEIHAIARELNHVWPTMPVPRSWPSQPCPHNSKGRMTDGSGRTLIYCRDCGIALYYV